MALFSVVLKDYTIFDFDKGQLVQEGSHDTLVAVNDGKYDELWRAQAQYYKT